jgi:hypothetical protein
MGSLLKLVAAASVVLITCGQDTSQPSEPPLPPAPEVVCREHVPGHLDPVRSLQCLHDPTPPRQVAECC